MQGGGGRGRLKGPALASSSSTRPFAAASSKGANRRDRQASTPRQVTGRSSRSPSCEVSSRGARRLDDSLPVVERGADHHTSPRLTKGISSRHAREQGAFAAVTELHRSRCGARMYLWECRTARGTNRWAREHISAVDTVFLVRTIKRIVPTYLAGAGVVPEKVRAVEAFKHTVVQ